MCTNLQGVGSRLTVASVEPWINYHVVRFNGWHKQLWMQHEYTHHIVKRRHFRPFRCLFTRFSVIHMSFICNLCTLSHVSIYMTYRRRPLIHNVLSLFCMTMKTNHANIQPSKKLHCNIIRCHTKLLFNNGLRI